MFSCKVLVVGAKSLLDIQREEATQAKARASSDAAKQAANPPTTSPKPASSWGKAVARSTPPGKKFEP